MASDVLACGEALPVGARTSESARYVVRWQPSPSPPVVGEHFVIDLFVCPKPGASAPREVRVDASMPEHRHGMNYRPTVKAAGESRYAAQGLLFHMPGRWVLEFELLGERGSDRVTAELVVR